VETGRHGELSNKGESVDRVVCDAERLNRPVLVRNNVRKSSENLHEIAVTSHRNNVAYKIKDHYPSTRETEEGIPETRDTSFHAKCACHK
jgi:hypothetical protein